MVDGRIIAAAMYAPLGFATPVTPVGLPRVSTPVRLCTDAKQDIDECPPPSSTLISNFQLTISRNKRYYDKKFDKR
ncbi:hypothetical protein SeLEV6574_g02889 [Synchytrium endobioticum]|nr:hypothetical protein SeLEV6574_g02889 [Synchytrium endobioticum]